MLLLAMLLSCSDIGINEIKRPSIIVAPEMIDFGHLESGHESDTRRITITNGGTADLVVDHIEIVGTNYTVEEEGFVVPGGGWHQIEVAYSPQTFEHNEGHVDIYLEDDEQPSASVWLNGNGDAPVINVTPLNHNFGAPLLGCDTTQEITIQNDGNIDLEVTDINIMANIPPEIVIDFGSLPEFPWIIPPGGRVDFFANYAPMDQIITRYANPLSINVAGLNLDISNQTHPGNQITLASSAFSIPVDENLGDFEEGTMLYSDLPLVLSSTVGYSPTWIHSADMKYRGEWDLSETNPNIGAELQKVLDLAKITKFLKFTHSKTMDLARKPTEKLAPDLDRGLFGDIE